VQIMTKPDDNDGMPYVAALHHLRQTEQLRGTDPGQSRDCPTPGELTRFALGQTTDEAARIAAHVEGCPYCRPALRSLRAFLNDEPLADLPDEGEDPLANWGKTDQPPEDTPEQRQGG
jgi:hypothetical protein